MCIPVLNKDHFCSKGSISHVSSSSSSSVAVAAAAVVVVVVVKTVKPFCFMDTLN